MQRLSLLLSLSLVLAAPTFSSCKSDNATPRESLPPATDKGLETGGFRLDGVLWVALQQNLFAPEQVRASIIRAYDGQPGYALSVFLKRSPADEGYSNPGTGLQLYVPNITGPGRFELGQVVPISIPSGWPAYGLYTAPDNYPATVPYSNYYTGRGSGSTGHVLITRFDRTARVVSGTFDFTAGTGSSQIKITEGRFDAPLEVKF